MPNRNFLQAFPDQDLIQPCLQEGSLLPPQTFTDSAAVSRRLWKAFQDGSESVVYKQLEALFTSLPLEPGPRGGGGGDWNALLSSHQERVYSALFSIVTFLPVVSSSLAQ